jgi:hypothetical protein
MDARSASWSGGCRVAIIIDGKGLAEPSVLSEIKANEAALADEGPATQWPIDMKEAAGKLHCSVRWLQEHLRKHPVGRKAGRSRLFTKGDFISLVDSLPRYEGAPILRMELPARKARKRIQVTQGETWKERQTRRIHQRWAREAEKRK